MEMDREVMRIEERRTGSKQKRRYDLLENETDTDAKLRFHRPAHVHSKLTTIAAIRIIERNIDNLDTGSRRLLEDIAQKCLQGSRSELI